MDLDTAYLASPTATASLPWDRPDGLIGETWDDDLPWEEGEWSPLWASWLDEGVRMSDGF